MLKQHTEPASIVQWKTEDEKTKTKYYYYYFSCVWLTAALQICNKTRTNNVYERLKSWLVLTLGCSLHPFKIRKARITTKNSGDNISISLDTCSILHVVVIILSLLSFLVPCVLLYLSFFLSHTSSPFLDPSLTMATLCSNCPYAHNNICCFSFAHAHRHTIGHKTRTEREERVCVATILRLIFLHWR